MLSTNKSCCRRERAAAQHPVELSDILERHLHNYRQHYRLHPDHYKVVGDILECRTSFLGGHVYQCDTCGREKNQYNSCRNRHCPKCQTMAKAKWLEARKAELLPVSNFHNVFTLPHEINPVALCNKKVVYGILFKAASETLVQFGKNPENGLGGTLGVIAILHTWDQKLNDHIHLHCLIPGGVLSFNREEWKGCSNDFLFHVKALSRVFRGKFMELLNSAYLGGQLIFPGETEPFGTRDGFKKLTKALWSKGWVVYSKSPFSSPEKVLGYLARYTHRVAISNNRIKECKDGNVTFTYRNRDKETTETMTLTGVEFIRRFLLHVIPKNFMRIRHYGLFANRSKKQNIGRCRSLLGLSAILPKQMEKSVEEMMKELTGKDISVCPFCKKGTLKEVREIRKKQGDKACAIIYRPIIKDSS